MIAEVQTDLNHLLQSQFGATATDAQVERAADALVANGFRVRRAVDAADAKRIVLDLIPSGSVVHRGASQTLDVTGITNAIETSEQVEALWQRLWAMDRRTQADELRRLASAPDIMLGSVQAVTETGSLLAASMGGSQLGPYASGAGRVILVVGSQKIVADVEEGLRRIYDHALPLEDARAQAAYGINSSVNKVLIINREVAPDRITIVLVDEALGF